MIKGQGLESAQAVRERGNTVTGLHRGLLTALLTPSAGFETQTAVDVTLADHHYERFTDHAASIAGRIEAAVGGGPDDGVCVHSGPARESRPALIRIASPI